MFCFAINSPTWIPTPSPSPGSCSGGGAQRFPLYFPVSRKPAVRARVLSHDGGAPCGDAEAGNGRAGSRRPCRKEAASPAAGAEKAGQSRSRGRSWRHLRGARRHRCKGAGGLLRSAAPRRGDRPSAGQPSRGAALPLRPSPGRGPPSTRPQGLWTSYPFPPAEELR